MNACQKIEQRRSFESIIFTMEIEKRLNKNLSLQFAQTCLTSRFYAMTTITLETVHQIDPRQGFPHFHTLDPPVCMLQLRAQHTIWILDARQNKEPFLNKFFSLQLFKGDLIKQLSLNTLASPPGLTCCNGLKCTGVHCHRPGGKKNL